jgi:hypothetical protein
MLRHDQQHLGGYEPMAARKARAIALVSRMGGIGLRGHATGDLGHRPRAAELQREREDFVVLAAIATTNLRPGSPSRNVTLCAQFKVHPRRNVTRERARRAEQRGA